MKKFYVYYPLEDGQKGAEDYRRTVTETAQREQDRCFALGALQEGSREAGEAALGLSRRSLTGKARSRRFVASALLASLPLLAADPSTKSRALDYTEGGDIPHLYIQKGYETEVRIDKAESIVAATTGLADFQPSFVGHVAVLKFLGTNVGQKTDLRILCASGNEYSFVVEEVSKRHDVQADLNVFVKSEDDEAKRAMLAPPKLFTADQVAAIQAREKDAQEALQREQDQHKSDASKAALSELTKLDCSYRFYDRKGEDFQPSACTDNRFTTVTVHTQEVPSFYELRDGKESLVQATYSDGHYVIPKVISDGELSVGKSRVKFKKVS